MASAVMGVKLAEKAVILGGNLKKFNYPVQALTGLVFSLKFKFHNIIKDIKMKKTVYDLFTKERIISYLKNPFPKPARIAETVGLLSAVTYFGTPALTGLVGLGKALLIGASIYAGGMIAAAPAAVIGAFTGFQISKIFKRSEKAQSIGAVIGAATLGISAGLGGMLATQRGMSKLLIDDKKQPVTEVFNQKSVPQADSKTFVLTPKAIAQYTP